MTIHDIAIRVDKHDSKNVKVLLKSLNERAIKYIWFKEKKKKSGLLHYHGRLHIESDILLVSYEHKLRRELRAFYAGSKMSNPYRFLELRPVTTDEGKGDGYHTYSTSQFILCGAKSVIVFTCYREIFLA